MKKNTLGKWMLAGTALVFAFACQKKTPDTMTENDTSSCGCNSACSTVTVPAVSDQTVEVKTTIAVTDEATQATEEVATYTIEIETEEVAAVAPIVVEPVVESVKADDLAEVAASSTTSTTNTNSSTGSSNTNVNTTVVTPDTDEDTEVQSTTTSTSTTTN